MKIFYNCSNSGQCSAFWVREYIESVKPNDDGYEVEYIKVNNDFKNYIRNIETNENIYLLDFSVSQDEIRMVLNVTQNVVWIDCIKTEQSDIKGIRCEKVPGCVLTFWYLSFVAAGREDEILQMTSEDIAYQIELVDSAIPYATRLIGDYAMGTSEYRGDTERFHYGFNTYDHEPTDDIWKILRSDAPPLMKEIMLKGTEIINNLKVEINNGKQ